MILFCNDVSVWRNTMCYIIPVFSVLLLVGCSPTLPDRLTPNGQSIDVPQGKQFCKENPGDDLCTD